ncbi:hypothetical protein [Bacillus sp. FJAT-49736]|uniref:hypothetical protein n=1 Tax=Bacillus sp. FJAT-49736 TaxID=2833582 RepID=UPI001BCA100A|nr:hypothetical protein [Bacillus sp. FJAT-49736]MBS4172330.1 hypothetical protein [Bacillus sp. FJAT-49736]
MKKIMKWTILPLIIILSFLFLTSPASAKGEIQVKADIGYDGTVKTGRGVPVHIKLINKGEDFNGDLLINFAPTYNSGGAKVLHVQIPAHSQKSYTISIPGFSEDMGFSNDKQPFIHLFEGKWQNGHEAAISGALTDLPKVLSSDSAAIGFLSENYDRLKELKVLQLANSSSSTFSLSKDNFPTDSTGLEFFDFIVVDEFALTTLDSKQQDALLNWVKKGGVLIAGGTPNGIQSFGKLQSSMPLDLNTETTLHNISFLKSDPKPSFKSLPIFTGKVADDAKIIVSTESHPVIVQKSVGSGKIVQMAFSIGDAPLSSWRGYSGWFSNLLDNSENTNLKGMLKDDNLFNNMMYQIGDVNDLFPSSYFSLGILIVVLVGYIIIVVPVMYLFLRKLDKREHAWWLIPVLSILFSGGIFATGAKDRIASPHENQMGVYKVNEDGSLFGFYTSTLMSNTSGDYKVEYPINELNAIPFFRVSNMNNGQIYKQATLEDNHNQQELTFPNVEFWSTRSFYSFAHKDHVGQFMADLSLQDGKLTGNIKNEFPYNFKTLYIWSGSNTYELGAVKKGESVTVNKDINEPFLSSLQYTDNIAYQINMNRMNASDIEPMKEEVLKLVAARINNSDLNDPVIVGITEDDVVKTNFVGKKMKSEKLSFIYQPFQVKNDFKGPFTLDSEQISLKIKALNGNIIDENTGQKGVVMLDGGEYELNYQLPQQVIPSKTILEEIRIVLEDNALTKSEANTNYRIFDYSTNEYIKLNSKNRVVILHDHPERFVLNNKLKLKLIKSGNEHPEVKIPQITLKGDIRP